MPDQNPNILFEEKFDSSATNEELLETFNKWRNESEPYWEQVKQHQKISLEYYHGNQTYKSEVPDYLSDTVENRIFEAVETLTPVATANAHQFTALPGSDNEMSVMKAEKLQKVLVRKYETLHIQKKLEDITRDLLVQRYGVAKWEWDTELDDIGVSVIDPKMIMVPQLNMDPHRLPYVIEVQAYTKADLEENFPDKNSDDIISGADKFDSENKDKDTVMVYEVWTDEFVAWMTKTEVLKKDPNPYWDFAGEEQKEPVEGKRLKRKKTLRFFNHLNRPEKPYVFFATFNISEGPLPKVSLAEIGIPIQDAINAQKRSIINNLKQTGNGQVYVDSDAMTQEEAENLTNEPGLVVRGAGLASEQKIRREAGTPLPNAHFSNLQHSETVFDNIFGVHSATRGQAQAKTLGQDILSRQQDFTRVDTITRVLNRGVARLANGLVQLMRMYYNETHLIKILGEEGSVEFLRFNRDDIDDHVEIYVKGDTALPMDEVSKRTEAVQLWQLGALDPVTLFERLKFPNPTKAAERLFAWKQGQLDAETMAKIQQDSAGEQAKAQFNPGGGAAGATGGNNATSSSGENNRSTETPQNVLQRARQNLGGTAPTK